MKNGKGSRRDATLVLSSGIPGGMQIGLIEPGVVTGKRDRVHPDVVP